MSLVQSYKNLPMVHQYKTIISSITSHFYRIYNVFIFRNFSSKVSNLWSHFYSL